MIQAIIPSHLVSKYVGDLAVGASYIMQNFKVSNNDFSFKSTTHGYKLVFCGSTYVKKTELPEIPIDYFNILGLASIADGKFQPNVLVGTLIFIYIIHLFYLDYLVCMLTLLIKLLKT